MLQLFKAWPPDYTSTCAPNHIDYQLPTQTHQHPSSPNNLRPTHFHNQPHPASHYNSHTHLHLRKFIYLTPHHRHEFVAVSRYLSIIAKNRDICDLSRQIAIFANPGDLYRYFLNLYLPVNQAHELCWRQLFMNVSDII